jgi:hypothetical protein
MGHGGKTYATAQQVMLGLPIQPHMHNSLEKTVHHYNSRNEKHFIP